jgi:hypothetical protein
VAAIDASHAGFARPALPAYRENLLSSYCFQRVVQYRLMSHGTLVKKMWHL